MNAGALELVLARLYSDAALLAAFMQDPQKVARGAGLDEQGVAALLAIDREGLAMAAHSYSRKRDSHATKRSPRWRRRA